MSDNSAWHEVDIGGLDDYLFHVVPSTKHQGSDSYGELGGTQCGSIVAVAAVMSAHKPIGSWSPADLDLVLDTGHESHDKNPKKDSRNYVDVKDCCQTYELEGKQYSFNAEDYAVGRAASDHDQDYLHSLAKTLHDIIKDKASVALVYNGYTFGIFLDPHYAYFFNSHCSKYLEDQYSEVASVLKCDLSIAPSALSRLIEEAYKPDIGATANQRTIQLTKLIVSTQGNNSLTLEISCMLNSIGKGFVNEITIIVAIGELNLPHPKESSALEGQSSLVSSDDGSLDAFDISRQYKKKLDEPERTEGSTKWFKGPIDNFNFNKLKKLLKNVKPQQLQTEGISAGQIKMNKVE